MCARQVGPDKQGLLFGALGSIKSLALLSGAMLGGFIFAAIHRAGIDVVPTPHNNPSPHSCAAEPHHPALNGVRADVRLAASYHRARTYTYEAPPLKTVEEGLI